MRAGTVTFLSGAALFAGASAWAIHQQIGMIIAGWACEHAASGIWLTGVVMLLLLATGAALSGLGLRSAHAAEPKQARPRRFIAKIGLMAAGLFLFAMALQSAAALFLPGCAG